MPTFYLSLSHQSSTIIAEEIIRECRLSLEIECLGMNNLENFSRSSINTHISSCEALIILISRNEPNLEVKQFINNERLRYEITAALNQDIIIVPLLLDGAVLPEKNSLPGALKKLWNYKSYPLRSAFLQEDLEDPLDDIEEELNFKREVEEKMSLSVEESFERLANYDAKPNKPASLESSGAFDLRRVVESETIFLKKARGIGDKKSEKNALSALSLAYTRLGQTQKAIEYFILQLEIAREFGDKEEQCGLLASLGDAHAITGKLEHARKYFEEQKSLAIENGFTAFVGSSFNGLGFIYVKEKKIKKAIDCYLKALSSYREQEDHDKELELLVGIGLNYKKLEQWEEAASFFVQALSTAKYVENRKEESYILLDLAETYYQAGDTQKIKPALQQAEESLNARETTWAPPLKRRLQNLKKSLNLT